MIRATKSVRIDRSLEEAKLQAVEDETTTSEWVEEPIKEKLEKEYKGKGEG